MVLEDIDVVEQITNEGNGLPTSQAYESYDPYDSGFSLISRDAVEASHQGDIDTSELLQALPFVELDVDRYNGSARAEQHLNPSNFSISGGNYYDNNIMIDGVSVNSLMDVTQSQDNENYDEVNGQTTQTLYIDPELLEAVTVYDSNVPAEYGGFSGGVVDYSMREPTDEFGASISSSVQTDEMVNYLGADANGDPYPDYIKYKTAASFDIPVTEDLKLLATYSRTASESYYKMDDDYGGEEFTNGDTSQNFLLRSSYNINDDLSIQAMLLYSPYYSEYTSEDDINSERVSQSTGFGTYIKLNGNQSGFDWTSQLSFDSSDSSRDWDGDRYRWDIDSAYGGSLCDDKSFCNEGGFGDIDQYQKDYVWNLSATHDVGAGQLSVGSHLSFTEAHKSRVTTNTYYFESVVDETNGIICADGDSACNTDTVFTEKVVYRAYDADVGVYQHALWTKYQYDFDTVTIRTGLRYDYEDYLDNHDLAPRLSATWQPIADHYVTLGANRYYSTGTVAYAMKDATPAVVTYERELNDDGTVSDWVYSDIGTDYDYRANNIKTPYADELTQAITIPTFLDGSFRVKSVVRYGRDELSTSREYDSDGDLIVELQNEGETDYWGVALEWSAQYERHKFSANVRWSQTLTNYSSDNYFTEFDAEEFFTNYVYYDGEIMSETELSAFELAQNYAAPIKGSVNWSTTWWQERISTAATMTLTGRFDFIDDTGDNIVVDGASYDVYDEVTVDAYTEVNLNSKIKLWQATHSNAVLTVRISNLLNSNPYSESSTYQRGRAYWLGATVNF